MARDNQKAAKKEGNPTTWNSKNGPEGHYAKWGKSEGDEVLHVLTYMCDPKQKQRTKWTKLTHTEYRLVFARGRGWGLGEIGGQDQKVHTSSYKINNSWGCMYSIAWWL